MTCLLPTPLFGVLLDDLGFIIFVSPLQIHLTLLVHGISGLPVAALPSDGAWHSVCVSWSSSEGKWDMWTDGSLVKSGSDLYPGQPLGGDGVFIVGQGQEGDGDGVVRRFRSGESYCGNVTQLHVWDRQLGGAEVARMEKECTPPPAGLLYEWRISQLEIEPSLKNFWGNPPCQGEEERKDKRARGKEERGVA